LNSECEAISKARFVRVEQEKLLADLCLDARRTRRRNATRSGGRPAPCSSSMDPFKIKTPRSGKPYGALYSLVDADAQAAKRMVGDPSTPLFCIAAFM